MLSNAHTLMSTIVSCIQTVSTCSGFQNCGLLDGGLIQSHNFSYVQQRTQSGKLQKLSPVLMK